MENFIYIIIIISILLIIIYLINSYKINESFSNYNYKNTINEEWNDRLTTGLLINNEEEISPNPDSKENIDDFTACNNPYGVPTGMPCNYKPSYKGFPVGANESENKAKEKPGYASNLTNLNNDCSFSTEGKLSCNKNQNYISYNNNVNTWDKLGKENGWANQWENKIMFKDTYNHTNNAFPINSLDLKNKTKYEYGWTDNETNKYEKPSIIGVDGLKLTYN